MNIKCIRGNVLIEPVYPEKTGLIFTDHVAKRDIPDLGRVVAMPGKRLTKSGVPIEHEFGVGDIVVLKKFTCNYQTVGRKEFITVKENEVLAVMGKE